jgi:hypothetical protein
MAQTERLTKLEQQRERLNREIRREKDRLQQEQRKRDTRRKIILGGLVEKHCNLHAESDFAQEVEKLIAQYVTGETERALFGLSPLNKSKTVPAVNDDDGHQAASKIQA